VVNTGDIQTDQQLEKMKNCFYAFREKMQGVVSPNNDKKVIMDLQMQVQALQKQLHEKDLKIAILQKNI
jgi:hypothetical protein